MTLHWLTGDDIRNQDPDKIAHYHEIILRETERLTALIDNVLDFAKLEEARQMFEQLICEDSA